MEEEKSGGVHQHTRLGGRGSEREREREQAHGGERVRERLAPPFICFFPPPGPALCKLGLARSAVCSSCSPHSGPQTFL